jgi:hypothetical protein
MSLEFDSERKCILYTSVVAGICCKLKQRKMVEPGAVAELPSTTLKAHLAARLRQGISAESTARRAPEQEQTGRQCGLSRIPVREALMQEQGS